jgi:GTP-binding protein
MPGLVVGAHKGYGLGHRFLKHIERTQVFIHLLDATLLLTPEEEPVEGSDTPPKTPLDHLMERYTSIRNELGLFNEKLLHKPEVIVLNKLDALNFNEEELQEAKKAVRQRIASARGTHPINGEPFVISAVSGQGLEDLVFAIYEQVKLHRAEAWKKDPKSQPSTAFVFPDDERIRK